MQMTAKLNSVVINGTDLEPLISFWKALLGVEELSRFHDFVWLKPQDKNGVNLTFQKVPEEKQTARNRLHLDLGVKDLAEAEARVLEGRCWTVPVLSGGRLYARNMEKVICIDLRK